MVKNDEWLDAVERQVRAHADAPAFELVGVEGYQPDEEMVALAVEHEILIALEALIRIDAE